MGICRGELTGGKKKQKILFQDQVPGANNDTITEELD